MLRLWASLPLSQTVKNLGDTSMSEAITNHLKQTLFESKGLPGWFFTSEEVLQSEKNYFFRHSWLCIGLVNDVKEEGDVYPVTMLKHPLLMVRGRDSLVRVFHNVCSHRGVQLIDQARKCATIVCPYHAWSYGLTGELKQTPHVGGENIHDCEEINKSELGLKEVRSGIWAGLLFVNLSGDAVSLEEQMGPLWSE